MIITYELVLVVVLAMYGDCSRPVGPYVLCKL